jgi:exosortase sorting signal-containing protein
MRNQCLFLLLSLLFAASLFLSLTEKGFSGLAQGPECCQFAPDQCADLVEGGPACLVEDVVPGFCNETTGLCEASQATAIPALGEWGLAAVVLALGAAGFIFYRRRRSPA